MKTFIPFALPDIGDEEIAEVVETLKSGWITTGPKAKKFESDFAAFIGVDHALAVNSATAGLHLALEAVGVKAGDRVVVPVHTFTATAEVVRYLGADPVFVDVEPDTMNMDVSVLSAVLDQTCPKVIIPVHFAGQACDMEPILALAQQHNARVVEDAAHAFPTSYRGRSIGSFGDIAVFSFYATKTIATGEGGMLVTNDEQVAQRARTMRLHGINRDVFDRYTSTRPSWFYEVVAPGFKYNLTDIAASLGIHQLRRAESMRSRREAIAKYYDEQLGHLPVQLPTVRNSADTHAWHLYVLQLRLDELTVGRDRIIELLTEEGIGTSVHFIPLHLQPYWRDRYSLRPADFPASTAAFERILSLPIYTRMDDAAVERVAMSVRSVLERHRKL